MRVAAFLLITFLAAAGSAPATTYTGQGPNAGAWNDPANWSPSTGFPNSTSDTAVINGGATPFAIAIPAGSPITLLQLDVNGGNGRISIVGVASSITFVPAINQPAIDVTGAGGLELNTPIVLARDCIVNVAASSGITFQKAISETGGARELRKQGAGGCSTTPRTPTPGDADQRRVGAVGAAQHDRR